MILLDANILLRMCNNIDADYKRTIRVIFDFRKRTRLLIASQTLYEFWAVATRDRSVNGLGMTRDRATRWVSRYLNLFDFVAEPPSLFQAWYTLVGQSDIRGFRAHDARYVALMQVIGISELMTYNVKHYATLPIKVIDPGNC